MRHAHYDDGDALVLDRRHDAVVPHAPAPIAVVLALERGAGGAGVGEGGDAGFEGVEDAGGGVAVELLQLLRGDVVEEDGSGRGGGAVLGPHSRPSSAFSAAREMASLSRKPFIRSSAK